MTVVVFDMDDTLFPEEAFVRSALAEAGAHVQEKRSICGFTDELLRLFSEGRRGDLFQAAANNLGTVPFAKEELAELLAIYRQHRPSTLPWFPDAEAIIDTVASTHPLELISDGYLPTQSNKFAALGASRWFKDPIFTEAMGREFWKPSPRAFELVMSRHPRMPCVYVADNPSKDFVAPNALGWLTVQVARPSGVHAGAEPAPGGKPVLRIDSLHGLPLLLMRRHQ